MHDSADPQEKGARTSAAPVRPRPGIAELARWSLLLGATGFGGGLTVLATIRSHVVERRRWLTEREFTNTATVAQMLPGGAAANALTCIGLRFGGLRGAVAAYVGFTLPGVVAITALAWAYVRFGALPRADAFLAGLNEAVVGIVVAITFRMLRTAVARPWQMGVAAGALLLSLAGGAGSGEVVLMAIGVGLVWDLGIARAALLRFGRARRHPAPPVALPEGGEPLPRSGAPATGDPPDPPPGSPLLALLPFAAIHVPTLLRFGADLLPMAAVFFRTGLGAYGGGFAIIPGLASSVHAHGWLSERQFADAVAVGKLTPGPVLLMATFVGYVRFGLAGAFVATTAILTAPFALVVVLATWLDRVRSRRWMRAALRGLTPAVVGLMAAAALTLGAPIRHATGLAVAAAVALTLVRFEALNPVVLLVVAGAARAALHYVGM